MVRPGMSYRVLELGGDEFGIGLLAAAYAVLPLVGAIQVGRLAGRWRRAAAIPLVGAGILLVGALLAAVATDLVVLGIASALVGFGNVAVAIGAQSWIARAVENERMDSVFGWLTAAMSLGQAAGPLVTGLVVEATGLAAPSFLLAAVSSAILIAFLLTGAAPHRHESADEVTSAWGVLRSPQVRSAMIVGIGLLTAADLVTAYLPVVGERAGIPAVAIGALLAARGVASAASRLLIGPLSRRWSRETLVFASTVGAAATMIVVATMPWLASLAVAMTVGGFLLGLGQPLTMAQVALAVQPALRSEALAVRLIGNRVGQLVVPLAAGAAATGLGVAAVFWLQGVLLVGTAAVAWPASRFRGPDTPPH